MFDPFWHFSTNIAVSSRLSDILRHQATLLEHIVTEQRYYSDYYLVTFYGNFPGAIRDKRFIVSLTTFCLIRVG